MRKPWKKKKKDKKKQGMPIGTKVTIRMAILLMTVLIIFSVLISFLVIRFRLEENRKLADAVSSLYADTLIWLSDLEGIPTSVEHPDNAIRYGEYICEWYDSVDQVCIYLPDEMNNRLTIVAAMQTDRAAERDGRFKDFLNGQVVEHEFTPEEFKVFAGFDLFANSVGSIFSEDAYSTEFMVYDSFGNRLVALVDMNLSGILKQIYKTIFGIFLIVLSVIALVLLIIYFIIRKHVMDPAKALAGSLDSFLKNGEKKRLEPPENASREYVMISDAFNRMEDNIDVYLSDINELTKEQANRQAEMNIAAGIQRGFLPDETLSSDRFVIRTLMRPAKDVGGDLYDYMQLDEDRVLLAIADVSGKGVSAAMFMSVLMTLIRENAKAGLMPDKILEKANDMLSEKNDRMMFATAFIGIYDSRDYAFCYSNAGHNLPYILGASGLQKLDGAKGTLLGLFEDEHYTTETVCLKPGDTLCLYTDGVNEATNAAKEFFGDGRLEALFESLNADDRKDVVKMTDEALRAFSEGSEQHDDVTMVSLSVTDTTELVLSPEIREIPKIREVILKLPIRRQVLLDLCLAAEEIFVNICEYAYEGRPEKGTVLFRLRLGDTLSMRFEDDGMPYDPLAEKTDIDEYDVDTAVGGLGKFISFSVTDHADYVYENGKNILTLTKKFKEDAK